MKGVLNMEEKYKYRKKLNMEEKEEIDEEIERKFEDEIEFKGEEKIEELIMEKVMGEGGVIVKNERLMKMMSEI